MTTKSHNYLYDYSALGKIICYYCRKHMSSISTNKLQSWNGKTVCDSCFLQLSHGIDVKVEGFFSKSEPLYNPIGNPIKCKMCKIVDLYKMFNGLYPKFCRECRIKFKKMVEENPKP